MVVPVGLNDHGHPLSMQFVGRAWDDAKMLGFGYALEQLAAGTIVATKLPKLRYDATATPKPIEIEPLPEPETEAPVIVTPTTTPTVPATVPSGSTAAVPALPRRFAAHVKRTGLRTFTTRGAVLLPSGLSRAAACNGRVQVTVTAGKRTLSTRRTSLTRRCTFTSKLSLSAGTLRGVSRLTVQVRFLGNAALKPESAASLLVRTK